MIIWHVSMSLDGYIAGPSDNLDWVFEYEGDQTWVDRVIASTGALLVGRRSYDVGRRDG
jgi:dihydrofolate reductase